ncbi:methyltransferase domain-containing protein [Streptomyces sp. NPDC091377]|uniref:methyltransferase domain-containing protein n=1 Tax=Streptomyces sp. NPDC091377 TaxID=3365995 RepID=UPI00380B8825
MHTPLVARCVRGLESAVAAEILALSTQDPAAPDSAAVTGLGHREIHFVTSGSMPFLRTADDVFLLAARRPDIGPAREALGALTDLVTRADPDTLLRLRRRAAPSADLTGVDVSASFLGRRAFNRYDAEDTVGGALARRLGVPYHSRRSGEPAPPGHWSWRLTLDGTDATLMPRAHERPLHRRAYKGRTVPGTLHPPVAAAMAARAELRPGAVVLDPCCGAGTLLAEGALIRPDARFLGLDLSGDAVRAARANTRGLPVEVERGDAGRVPLPDASVDRVLCNPPWGGQVRAGGALAAAPDRWWRELRRVLAPDGTAVLLLPGPGELAAGVGLGLTPTHVQRVRVAGAEAFLVELRSADRPSGRPGRTGAPARRARSAGVRFPAG